MAVSEWTEDECHKLIKNVKDQQLLWKPDHADYGKCGSRFHAWRKISSAMPKGVLLTESKCRYGISITVVSVSVLT